MEKKNEIVDSWIDEVLDEGREKIRLELIDYSNMMKTYSKVLCMVTNEKMSKPNYTFEAIEEVYKEEIDKLISRCPDCENELIIIKDENEKVYYKCSLCKKTFELREVENA